MYRIFSSLPVCIAKTMQTQKKSILLGVYDTRQLSWSMFFARENRLTAYLNGEKYANNAHRQIYKKKIFQWVHPKSKKKK